MREIFIKQEEKQRHIILVENGNMIEKYQELPEKKRLEGNIYLGKVQNVLQGMQAAFVDIGEGKNTFIHLKDVLPKKDTKQEEISQEKLKQINMKEHLSPGTPILVQVKRDATHKKGARVSKHISIASRYLVFMPETDIITISQKIEKEEEKKRLLEIIKNCLPYNCGAIIRTAAEGKKQEEIVEDIREVNRKWEEIKEKAKDKTKNFPRCIYEDDSLLKRILRDLMDQKIDQIITNDKDTEKEIKQDLQEIGAFDIVTKRRDDEDILNIYDLHTQIEKAENRKVWLKCGGFITIDKTEALTAIDVNSGKYIGSKNLEETVYLVNKEASIEIAKQLRLRDIGGIVIIDYIDMQEETNKEKIVEILKNELKKDRSKTQVLEFTKLNLLEMTRKHMCSN